ncbi:hypothetical protein AAC03nite_05030 [Alicyclobacillus acidoterrestris]|nr:hypothetical protein AAC03nite_05030 [Alicyclobacillus acidoterrestris]
MVGNPQEKQRFIQFAKDAGILNRIEWLGWLDDPWEHLDSASVLVLTSDFEGFGLVLVEALCRGVPVVASNCPVGPSDIVQNGKNGWLFNPGDVDELARILKKISDGSMSLPSIEECVKSIQKFRNDNVIRNMIQVMEHYTIQLTSLL